MALSAKNLLKALKVSLGAASPQPARMRVAHPQHMHQLAPAQQTEKLEPHTEGHLKAGLIRSRVSERRSKMTAWSQTQQFAGSSQQTIFGDPTFLVPFSLF